MIRGLHLFVFSKLGGTWLEPFSTPRIIPRWEEQSTTLPNMKIHEIRTKARLPSIRGLLSRFGTMGTMSHELSKKEWGGATRARRPIAEAVYKINIEESCK
jgi:hypothetical protein